MDKPETVDQYIERISSEFSVIKFDPDPEIENYLKASQKERYGWDAQKCYQIAFDLKKYDTYLGNIMAEINNRIDWLTRNLDMIYGKHAMQYGGQYEKFENRCTQLNVDNDKAIYLVKKIGETKAVKNIISAQLYPIRDFIRILESMGKVKNESERS